MNRHFRPQIQNGTVVKRTQGGVKSSSKAASRAAMTLAPLSPLWSSEAIEVGVLKQRGLSLLALDERLRSTEPVAKEKASTRPYALVGLLVCGALLAGGFMFSLRDHFIAHAFGREEVKLKSKTDQATIERQHIKARVDQATSSQVIDRQARENTDLAPLEFDQKKVVMGAKKIAATEKAKKLPVPATARSGRN